ncbi:MAG TPA: helix-turn-helix domain-containing protein [Methylomirabilota bacterium]|nr:helix-turn-helix domain-containing protein [Methylomirabilota bacterium]
MQVRILPPLPFHEIKRRLRGVHRAQQYCYLLGLYLGDGYINRTPRTYRLHIYLHRDDTAVIEGAARAIPTLRPGRPVGFRRKGAMTIVNSYSNAWPSLFPQHGPGRKHERRIVLDAWQRELVERHPTDFVRGCIDSDGCRHRRLVAGRDYPAYSFANVSEDILLLFTWACDVLGIRWRRANRETISIAQRADVARLDRLFGWTPQQLDLPLTASASAHPR